MSEIFISYAREDKARVAALATALEDCDWSVWWDPHIPTGKRFDDIIEQAIAEAKCVIVVWSRNSVASSYVRAEAAEGADRQILFPVMIEEVKIPLAFRQIQTASLIDWDGSRHHPSFDKFVRDISLTLTSHSGREPAAPDSSAASSAAATSPAPRPAKGARFLNAALRSRLTLSSTQFKFIAAALSAALVITFVILMYRSRQEGGNANSNSNTSIKNQNNAAGEVAGNNQNANTSVVVGGERAFTIELRYKNLLTPKQTFAINSAANRWSKIIVGDLPAVVVEGESIDDLRIIVQSVNIDGPGGILGQSGPTILRPETVGNAAYLPLKGNITLDSADLAQMEEDGTLEDVITREMGRVIGIGSGPRWTKLLQGENTSDPVFIGENARREYAALLGVSETRGVPVENTGGPGMRTSGWRESVFRNEVMTGYISSSGNSISRVTVGALQDMGYKVNYDGAEDYQLPKLIDTQ